MAVRLLDNAVKKQQKADLDLGARYSASFCTAYNEQLPLMDEAIQEPPPVLADLNLQLRSCQRLSSPS